MNELRIAYIRPTQRWRRDKQVKLVQAYEPTEIWSAREYSADDVIQMMMAGGRVLIVPTLDMIADRRAERNRVIKAVLEAGSTIIVASSDTEITPEHSDAVMTALSAKRSDISHADAVRAAREGGAKGYSVKELEACKELWTSAEMTGDQIAKESGISYATLWRYFTRTRAEPVKRGRGAGRR